MWLGTYEEKKKNQSLTGMIADVINSITVKVSCERYALQSQMFGIIIIFIMIIIIIIISSSSSSGSSSFMQ